MQRPIALLAIALAAGVTAGKPSTLETDIDGVTSCIVKGDLNKATKAYSLTVADCEDGGLKFAFAKQGAALRTADNMCLTSAAGASASKSGTSLVLSKCKGSSKGWKQIKGDYWRNTHGLCMTYDAEGDNLIQADCDHSTAFRMKRSQVTPSAAPAAPAAKPIPPAPAAPQYTCTNFAHACPKGTYTPSNYKYIAVTSQTAIKTCCVPAPVPEYRTCGDYARANGYPAGRACGAYGQLIPNLNTRCTSDRNCLNVCCQQVPPPKPQTCAAFGKCPYGWEKVFDSGSIACNGPCKVTDCCQKVVPVEMQMCKQWAAGFGDEISGPYNACGTNFIFMDTANKVQCQKDGANCKAKCCMQLTR